MSMAMAGFLVAVASSNPILMIIVAIAFVVVINMLIFS